MQYKKWTPSEKQFILDHRHLSDKQIAFKLTLLMNENITDMMVRRQRRKLGAIKLNGRPRRKRKYF
jgi:hypothetical protein